VVADRCATEMCGTARSSIKQNGVQIMPRKLNGKAENNTMAMPRKLNPMQDLKAEVHRDTKKAEVHSVTNRSLAKESKRDENPREPRKHGADWNRPINVNCAEKKI
jgi:hypothetical protein